MIDLLTLLIFYLILIFSIIGYGKLFLVFTKSEYNIGYHWLVGILFLIVISYITNFFSVHNYIHNTIVIGIGLINFLISLNSNFRKSAKDLKTVLLIFGILFIFTYKASKQVIVKVMLFLCVSIFIGLGYYISSITFVILIALVKFLFNGVFDFFILEQGSDNIIDDEYMDIVDDDFDLVDKE